MRKLVRSALLTLVLLLLGVSTAPAQTYELLADSTDLAPSSDTTDTQCLLQVSSDTFVFFNENAEGIYAWDNSSGALDEHRSASDLNSDVPDESNNFDNCDGTAAADGFAYFILRSSVTNENYVYRTDVSDASNNSFVAFSGANGLAVDDTTVYIAGYEFFGAPDDGIWTVADDLSESPSEFATNSDLSIDAVDVENGTLYGYSNSFGGGNFSETIFSLDVSASSPSFQSVASPYESGVFSTGPSGDGNDSILDVEAITFGETEYVVILNNSDGAPDGEEVGTIEANDPSNQSILFTEADLGTNISVEGYSAFRGEPLSANSNGEVFLASRGGPHYLASVSDAPPLPVEMAGFDAIQNGSSVGLTWQTASETKNAGFNVQLETEAGWTTLDFVESKVTGGTTTETQSYHYTVDQDLDPGTHRFRLEQKDLDGSTSLSDVVTVEVGLNEALTLQSPTPNPTGTQATIEFGVKEATETSIAVYNVLGQLVETVYRGTPQPGQMQEVTFNAGSLPSGVYFVRMQADGQTRTERLTVVR